MGCARSSAWLSDPLEPGDAGDFHERYSLGSKLGEGSFGQVRTAWHRRSRELRAVKVVSILDGLETLDPSLLRAARREARIWRLLGRHEHCVELHETFMDRHLYYMVMEKCEASLMDQLQEMPRMSEGGVARIFREMLLGIGHIHARSVVHRDVKPNNFLFGGPSGGTVKLCDFGMAAELPRCGLLRGSYGTAPYMSPEMISEVGHALSTDVWSFGATAYVLLYGEFPYVPSEASVKAMRAIVLKGEPEPTFRRSSPDMAPASAVAEAFVRALLAREPRRRPRAEEALLLPLLRREAAPLAAGNPPSAVSTEAVAPPASIALATAASPQGAISRAPSASAAMIRNLSGHRRRDLDGTVEDGGLAPVLREARRRTHQFEVPVNPTVQRSLDVLLKRLQERGNDSLNARSFSEPLAGEGLLPEDEGLPVMRRESKSSTHSGVLYTCSTRGGSTLSSGSALDLRFQPTWSGLSLEEGAAEKQRLAGQGLQQIAEGPGIGGPLVESAVKVVV